MIVSVCLNPCIDRMVTVDAFAYGGLNRILQSHDDGSGKGINVALACRLLGMQAACIGFMPKLGAELMTDRLEKGGCGQEFISLPGAVRVNMKVKDLSNGILTEINQPGESVSTQQQERMCDLVHTWSKKARVMVMTGSLPPGCGPDFYKILMEHAQCPCVLDAGGEMLLHGLSVAPFLIKPNTYELEMAVGRSLSTPQEVYLAAKELHARGAGMVAVSMGGDGAVFTDGENGWYAPPLPIDAVSATGAGDCMVAGMLYAIGKGESPQEILRHGAAGGSAGCLTTGTGLFTLQDFESLLAQVCVHPL